MKAIYPWAEMQIGDVREVSTHRSRKAVYSAAWEWAKKHANEDGSRPKFKVTVKGWKAGPDDWMTPGVMDVVYRIERTA